MCDDIRASVTISKRLQTLGGMAASVLAGTGAVFVYAGMLSSYSSWGAMSWPWSHSMPTPPGSRDTEQK